MNSVVTRPDHFRISNLRALSGQEVAALQPYAVRSLYLHAQVVGVAMEELEKKWVS